jgi:hypothetical protein
VDELQNHAPIFSAQDAASTVPSRLSILQRLKGYGFKRSLLICGVISVGLGIGIVIAAVSVASYLSRPISVTEWQKLDVPARSLRASLKTDWDGLVRYQFKIRPRTQDLIPAFSRAVQANRDTVSFTLHLYDKNGFELCNTVVKPTPVVDSENRVSEMEANDSFLYCDRSAYKNVDHWNLSYIFPNLAEIPDTNAKGAKESATKTGESTQQAVSGDDTLTGFDFSSGHLETLSGKTFFVYREGERMTALDWETEQEVKGGQAAIHFDCRIGSDCLIENPQRHQTVHTKLLK